MELEGDVEREIGLVEACVGAESGAHRYQPKSQVSVGPCFSSFAIAD